MSEVPRRTGRRGGRSWARGREAAGHKTMQIFAAAPQRCKVGPWGSGLD